MTKLCNTFCSAVFRFTEKSKHSLFECYSKRCWFLSSSTILSFVFWNASCKTFIVFFEMATLLDNFFFLSNDKIWKLCQVISNWFLYCSRRSCCCMRIFSCNAKKDEIMFSLLIFLSYPLVRIFDPMIT